MRLRSRPKPPISMRSTHIDGLPLAGERADPGAGRVEVEVARARARPRRTSSMRSAKRPSTVGCSASASRSIAGLRPVADRERGEPLAEPSRELGRAHLADGVDLAGDRRGQRAARRRGAGRSRRASRASSSAAEPGAADVDLDLLERQARDRLERAVGCPSRPARRCCDRVDAALAGGQRLGAARVAGDPVDARRRGSGRAAPSRRPSRRARRA